MRLPPFELAALLAVLCCGDWAGMALAQSPAATKPAPAKAPAEKPQPVVTMRVVTPGAALHKPDKSIMNLGRGTRLTVSKIRDAWIGGYALVGKERVAGWILRADLQPAPSDATVEAAVAKLAELGVTFERDAQGRPYSATDEEAKLTDADLVAFKPLVDLSELDLSNASITGAGLKEIAALAGLERLHLDNTAIDDDSLQSLAGLKQLTGLSLSDTKITDAGLKHLAGLKQIKVLNLANTPITDAGLAHLKDMQGMETLSLSSTEISGAGFVHFQNFQDLITLNLDGCALGPKALQNFHNLGKIRILRMYDALVPEDDVKALEEAVDGLAIFR